ncbi:MAG TPA: cytochrome c [Burkholderiales bacterium]|nr:cytochrome c [Burkholderiales bacterium]
MKRNVLIVLACFTVSPIALGQDSGDAEVGKKLADKWGCLLCHGPDGNGNKTNKFGYTPRISAQPQPYFIKSMRDYKTGKRSNDAHEVIGEQISDADVRNLAAWYGSQTPRAEATYDYDPNR